MNLRQFILSMLCAALVSGSLSAQNQPTDHLVAGLHLHLISSQIGNANSVPAVIWIEPLAGTSVRPFLPTGHYTLLQKNRMFIPHLQIVPVGSVVQFPNADPFFHNVFSLFDGRRFDLGLYEAGSSKAVIFPREGISYIFCNIHPEMSAVVLSLSTPFYAIADTGNSFMLQNIPPGDYQMRLWVEGVPQSALQDLTKKIHLAVGVTDLGEVKIPISGTSTRTHTNKFGRAYDQPLKSPY